VGGQEGGQTERCSDMTPREGKNYKTSLYSYGIGNFILFCLISIVKYFIIIFERRLRNGRANMKR